MNCGTSCLNVDDVPETMGWSFGACDYVWSNPSGHQSACCGGECYGSVFCGWSYLTVSVVVDAYWRVGACDKFWSYLSGIRYALCGGRYDYETDCGRFCLDLECEREHTLRVFGACDCLLSDLSDVRYALCGGRCGRGVNNGYSCLHVTDTPGFVNWNLGA